MLLLLQFMIPRHLLTGLRRPCPIRLHLITALPPLYIALLHLFTVHIHWCTVLMIPPWHPIARLPLCTVQVHLVTLLCHPSIPQARQVTLLTLLTATQLPRFTALLLPITPPLHPITPWLMTQSTARLLPDTLPRHPVTPWLMTQTTAPPLLVIARLHQATVQMCRISFFPLLGVYGFSSGKAPTDLPDDVRSVADWRRNQIVVVHGRLFVNTEVLV